MGTLYPMGLSHRGDSESNYSGRMLDCALQLRAGCIRGTILVSIFPAYQLSFAGTMIVLPFILERVIVAWTVLQSHG